MLSAAKRRLIKNEITASLQRWQSIFALGDWQICVLWKRVQPSERKQMAMSIEWPAPYRTATVSVYPFCFGLDPEVRDQTACHEMLHLITGPVDDEMRRLFGDEGVAWQRYHRQLETAIDRLAVALHNDEWLRRNKSAHAAG